MLRFRPIHGEPLAGRTWKWVLAVGQAAMADDREGMADVAAAGGSEDVRDRPPLQIMGPRADALEGALWPDRAAACDAKGKGKGKGKVKGKGKGKGGKARGRGQAPAPAAGGPTKSQESCSADDGLWVEENKASVRSTPGRREASEFLNDQASVATHTPCASAPHSVPRGVRGVRASGRAGPRMAAHIINALRGSRDTGGPSITPGQRRGNRLTDTPWTLLALRHRDALMPRIRRAPPSTP